ncbi:hypothetical protein R5W24_000541 [Gemmata sp. JC717]|uniref:hypothetical protein n=1 Tax=Gemmata algarum TaxID=2975278 RepID=UPI0021BBA44A|nr:hypothetical protein [Gemmata algarum]MDY3551465.1 hypothetical protein [Gemmata algarum]
MSDKPENTPAYPSGRMEGYEPAQFPQYEGLTMRDYFAGQAMQANILAADVEVNPDSLAKSAYRYADAMLAERAKA